MSDTTLYRKVRNPNEGCRCEFLSVHLGYCWELEAVDEPLFALALGHDHLFVFCLDDRDYLIDGRMVHVNDVEPKADCDSVQCPIHKEE